MRYLPNSPPVLALLEGTRRIRGELGGKRGVGTQLPVLFSISEMKSWNLRRQYKNVWTTGVKVIFSPGGTHRGGIFTSLSKTWYLVWLALGVSLSECLVLSNSFFVNNFVCGGWVGWSWRMKITMYITKKLEWLLTTHRHKNYNQMQFNISLFSLKIISSWCLNLQSIFQKEVLDSNW